MLIPNKKDKNIGILIPDTIIYSSFEPEKSIRNIITIIPDKPIKLINDKRHTILPLITFIYFINKYFNFNCYYYF